MTRFATVLTILFLAASFGAAAQESEVLTVQQAVEQFGVVIEDEGLTLVVIHLNDKSVQALFSTAPNMQALQTQAREASMFFVQGTNGTPDTLTPDLEWELSQGDNVITMQAVNIASFEPEAEVPAGERYSGLVVANQLVDLGSAFSMQNGDHQFDFSFSPDQVQLIEGTVD